VRFSEKLLAKGWRMNRTYLEPEQARPGAEISWRTPLDGKPFEFDVDDRCNPARFSGDD